MKTQSLLPKRVVDYIHEMGVRALDHLAANVVNLESANKKKDDEAPARGAVHQLVERWKSLSTPEKEGFVERVAASVIDVVAASAALPIGLKLGKKAARATRKVLKRKTKKLRKIARRSLSKEAGPKKKVEKAGPRKRQEKGANGRIGAKVKAKKSARG